jgi:hypothetical protein
MCAGAVMFPAPGFASGVAPAPRHPWPAREQAQRDFATSQLVVDAAAGRVWLISAPTNGVADAVEFFTGTKVNDVRVTPDGKRFTFVDPNGHQYTQVKAYPSQVNLDSPSANAGWQDGDRGHDVILGAPLGAGDAKSAMPLIASISSSIARTHFDGYASCEPIPYVTRTEGTRYQDPEPDFVAQTKIIADFDNAKKCWTTTPVRSVDLEDNTFLLVTHDRVFRIDSKNLTPAGSAPNLKIVDIKDK